MNILVDVQCCCVTLNTGANILMDLYGHVKIADFGASKLLRVSL